MTSPFFNQSKDGAPKTWKKLGASKAGSPKGTAPKGGAPKGGRPKIALFFLPLLAQFSFFLLSLEGLVVEFWWCVRSAGTLKFARLEFSGCRVKPRPPVKRRVLLTAFSHCHIHVSLDHSSW